MSFSFDLDELRSRGKVLVIKSPFLPKAPTDPNHWVAPENPDVLAWKQATIARARELADQVVAQLNPARRAELERLRAVQVAANDALNTARNELQALSAPPPADANIDVLTAREIARAGRVMGILTLEARANAANQALGDAITEVRSHLESLGFQTTFRQAQRDLNAIDEQIETLQQQRGALEQAMRDARSMVLTYGSEGYHGFRPVAPPPVVEQPTKRRGLFG